MSSSPVSPLPSQLPSQLQLQAQQQAQQQAQLQSLVAPEGVSLRPLFASEDRARAVFVDTHGHPLSLPLTVTSAASVATSVSASASASASSTGSGVVPAPVSPVAVSSSSGVAGIALAGIPLRSESPALVLAPSSASADGSGGGGSAPSTASWAVSSLGPYIVAAPLETATYKLAENSTTVAPSNNNNSSTSSSEAVKTVALQPFKFHAFTHNARTNSDNSSNSSSAAAVSSSSSPPRAHAHGHGHGHYGAKEAVLALATGPADSALGAHRRVWAVLSDGNLKAFDLGLSAHLESVAAESSGTSTSTSACASATVVGCVSPVSAGINAALRAALHLPTASSSANVANSPQHALSSLELRHLTPDLLSPHPYIPSLVAVSYKTVACPCPAPAPAPAAAAISAATAASTVNTSSASTVTATSGVVGVWDIDTNTLLALLCQVPTASPALLQWESHPSGPAAAMAWSPCGALLAVTYGDGVLRVWDPRLRGASSMRALSPAAAAADDADAGSDVVYGAVVAAVALAGASRGSALLWTQDATQGTAFESADDDDDNAGETDSKSSSDSRDSGDVHAVATRNASRSVYLPSLSSMTKVTGFSSATVSTPLDSRSARPLISRYRSRQLVVLAASRQLDWSLQLIDLRALHSKEAGAGKDPRRDIGGITKIALPRSLGLGTPLLGYAPAVGLIMATVKTVSHTAPSAGAHSHSGAGGSAAGLAGAATHSASGAAHSSGSGVHGGAGSAGAGAGAGGSVRTTPVVFAHAAPPESKPSRPNSVRDGGRLTFLNAVDSPHAFMALTVTLPPGMLWPVAVAVRPTVPAVSTSETAAAAAAAAGVAPVTTAGSAAAAAAAAAVASAAASAPGPWLQCSLLKRADAVLGNRRPTLFELTSESLAAREARARGVERERAGLGTKGRRGGVGPLAAAAGVLGAATGSAGLGAGGKLPTVAEHGGSSGSNNGATAASAADASADALESTAAFVSANAKPAYPCLSSIPAAVSDSDRITITLALASACNSIRNTIADSPVSDSDASTSTADSAAKTWFRKQQPPASTSVSAKSVSVSLASLSLATAAANATTTPVPTAIPSLGPATGTLTPPTASTPALAASPSPGPGPGPGTPGGSRSAAVGAATGASHQRRGNVLSHVSPSPSLGPSDSASSDGSSTAAALSPSSAATMSSYHNNSARTRSFSHAVPPTFQSNPAALASGGPGGGNRDAQLLDQVKLRAAIASFVSPQVAALVRRKHKRVHIL